MQHLRITTKNTTVTVENRDTGRTKFYNCESVQQARNLGRTLRAARVTVEWFRRRTLAGGSEAESLAQELQESLDSLAS